METSAVEVSFFFTVVQKSFPSHFITASTLRHLGRQAYKYLRFLLEIASALWGNKQLGHLPEIVWEWDGMAF